MFATYTISYRQKNNTDHIPIIDHEYFFSTIRSASGNRLARGTLESCWLHPCYNCFVLPIQNTMSFNNSYKYTCNFCLTRSLIGWKKLPFIVWRILTAQSEKKVSVRPHQYFNLFVGPRAFVFKQNYTNNIIINYPHAGNSAPFSVLFPLYFSKFREF